MVGDEGVKTTLKVGGAKHILLNISKIIKDTVLQKNLSFKRYIKTNHIFDKFLKVSVNKFSWIFF